MAQVKTAISIHELLFKEIDELAHQMKISRSQLFSLAAKEFILGYRNQALLEQINQAYSDEPKPEEKRLLSKQRSYHRQLVKDQW